MGSLQTLQGWLILNQQMAKYTQACSKGSFWARLQILLFNYRLLHPVRLVVIMKISVIG